MRSANAKWLTLSHTLLSISRDPRTDADGLESMSHSQFKSQQCSKFNYFFIFKGTILRTPVEFTLSGTILERSPYKSFQYINYVCFIHSLICLFSQPIQHFQICVRQHTALSQPETSTPKPTTTVGIEAASEAYMERRLEEYNIHNIYWSQLEQWEKSNKLGKAFVWMNGRSETKRKKVKGCVVLEVTGDCGKPRLLTSWRWCL